MGRQDRFAQPFADIWQHVPFPRSARLAEFLERFMESGRFDAERFWEFVSAQLRGSKTAKRKDQKDCQR